MIRLDGSSQSFKKMNFRADFRIQFWPDCKAEGACRLKIGEMKEGERREMEMNGIKWKGLRSEKSIDYRIGSSPFNGQALLASSIEWKGKRGTFRPPTRSSNDIGSDARAGGGFR